MLARKAAEDLAKITQYIKRSPSAECDQHLLWVLPGPQYVEMKIKCYQEKTLLMEGISIWKYLEVAIWRKKDTHWY